MPKKMRPLTPEMTALLRAMQEGEAIEYVPRWGGGGSWITSHGMRTITRPVRGLITRGLVELTAKGKYHHDYTAALTDAGRNYVPPAMPEGYTP